MGRKDKAMQITKQNLTDAFWSLYLEMPVEHISVRAIVERAGYNRGTFYLYFKDVRDVLEQLEDTLLTAVNHLFCKMPDILRSRADLPQLMMQLYDLHEPYMSKLLGPTGDPQFYKRVMKQLKPEITIYLARCTKLNSKQLDYAAEFVLSSCFMVISLWYANGQDLSIEELSAMLLLFLEKGILSTEHQVNREESASNQ